MAEKGKGPKNDPLRIARQEMVVVLDGLFAARDKSFDWAEMVPDVAKHLLDKIAEGSAEAGVLATEVAFDVSRRLTRDYVQHKGPKVPSDASQLALFYDADAALTLGGREIIRMALATAQDLERHRTVLTNNFQAQAQSYFAWTNYIDDRLPKLREQDCTLADIEEAEDDGDDGDDGDALVPVG